MFLRNYYNLVARLLINMESSASGDFGDSSLVLRAIDGNLLRTVSQYGSYAGDIRNYIPTISELPIWTSSMSYKCIAFGSGNEPVTFDDYTLGTLLSEKFNFTTVSVSGFNFDGSTKKFSVKSKYTLSNITSDIVTIREYGIISGEPGHTAHGILIFRDLIEPYSLQPSESVNVILTTSYTMPIIDESGNVVAGSQAYGLAIE